MATDNKRAHLGLPPGKQGSADYYRKGFNSMVRIVKLQAAIIGIMTIGLAFFTHTNGNNDRFFAETAEGRRLRMAGLDSPNMGRAAISNWAANAVSQIMTFGFNDIDERFALSRLNFTPRGWEIFRKGIIQSKLMDVINSAQQILTTIPQDVPVLKKEGLIDGVYTWEFDIPLLLTFRAGSEKNTATRMAHVVIQQVSTRNSPAGLGVGISELKIRQ